MVPIRPTQFPYKAIRQLETCGVGPLKVLKWVRPNSYINDFPIDYEIVHTFNIEDLVTYKGPTSTPI